MVDPNPARGMPLQLQRYWLAGKGALKIRWNVPGDFKRCVRQLRKYFPTNPEGLCNILHTKATGGPPGHGSLEKHVHSLQAAAELMAKQPELGQYLWAGPLAPIGRTTEEPRIMRRFDPGALRHRSLPLPLDWREHQANGHEGAVTVGRIMGIHYGPDHEGQEWAYAWGDFLNEDIIPAAKKARYLVEQGVIGASIDPGGKVVASMDPVSGMQFISEYTIGGGTMVSIPAFSAMHLFCLDEEGEYPDDDPDMVMDLDEDCGCEGPELSMTPPSLIKAPSVYTPTTYAVNSEGWRGLPLAQRESVFDNDDAVKRIMAWASAEGGQVDVGKLKQAFMWQDPRQPETQTQSYRLPVGDIINGRLTLIFHAIYAAAALISGAHGGLPDVPDADKNQLRTVISEIYTEMATAFNDPSVRAPWDSNSIGNAVAEGFKPQAAENAGKFAAQEDGMAKRAGIENSGAVTAAARLDQFPTAPPKEWFDDPGLEGPTGLTITEQGRVFGHIAQWGVCHRDFNECVLAPKSHMDYRPFHLGNVKTEEGDLLRVGKIMMDTRHADVRLGYAAASFHYDDTGDEVAQVRAGEDEFGIWVSGAIVPEATNKKVAKLRRSPISGDWRTVEGHLELVAALAVNVPAFPVYSMDGTETFSLVAAGMLLPPDEDESDDLTSLFASIGKAAESMVDDEELEERRQLLADIADDEEIYSQRERAEKFAMLAAAEAPVAPVPAAPPAPAPAAVAPAAPAPAAVAPKPTGDQLLAMPQDERITAMNAMGVFSVVEEPSGMQGKNTPKDTTPVPAPVAPVAPVAPLAPVPVVPVASA